MGIVEQVARSAEQAVTGTVSSVGRAGEQVLRGVAGTAQTIVEGAGRSLGRNSIDVVGAVTGAVSSAGRGAEQIARGAGATVERAARGVSSGLTGLEQTVGAFGESALRTTGRLGESVLRGTGSLIGNILDTATQIPKNVTGINYDALSELHEFAQQRGRDLQEGIFGRQGHQAIEDIGKGLKEITGAGAAERQLEFDRQQAAAAEEAQRQELINEQTRKERTDVSSSRTAGAFRGQTQFGGVMGESGISNFRTSKDFLGL